MLSRNSLLRFAGLLALTALVAAACNTAAANGNSGLANTEWLLSTMDGAPIASGTNVTLGFGLAQASGNSGCNDYTTSYQTSGSHDLVFGNIAATRKLCDQAANVLEAKYFASLAQVARFALAGGNLTLLDRANSAVLTFAPAPAQSLEGPWTVTMVNNGTGGVASVPAGVSGAMSFFANGTIEGFGGCNNFSGSYTVKGDSLDSGTADVDDDGLPRSGRDLRDTVHDRAPELDQVVGQRRHARSTRRWRRAAGGGTDRDQVGRLNQNVVRPAVEVAPTRPPASSISRLTMARPMPAPPVARSRDFSMR